MNDGTFLNLIIGHVISRVRRRYFETVAQSAFPHHGCNSLVTDAVSAVTQLLISRAICRLDLDVNHAHTVDVVVSSF